MSDVNNIIDWAGVKRMTFDEFLRLAEPENRAALVDLASNPAYMVDGIVCFQNQIGLSPDWGNRHFFMFGADVRCVAPTVEELLAATYRGATAIAYYQKDEKPK